MNRRGSGSSAKLWRHRHTGAHLSTNFEQTLRRHDAGRAADCWHPLGGRERWPCSSSPRLIEAAKGFRDRGAERLGGNTGRETCSVDWERFGRLQMSETQVINGCGSPELLASGFGFVFYCW